jgi:excisionase family DNA binding protein
MSALALDLQDVHEPTAEGIEAARAAARTLASAARGHRLRVSGDAGKSEASVELPASIFKTLIEVLAQIGNGNTVAIIPIQAELTTQQAADLLNVSRPHLVKLLERGDIQHHMAGTHRRIKAQDILNYKAKTDHKPEATLAKIAAIDEELGLYDDEKIAEEA